MSKLDTSRLFQIAYEGDFQSLSTVTFWQKVTFLISNVHYYSWLYGMHSYVAPLKIQLLIFWQDSPLICKIWTTWFKCDYEKLCNILQNFADERELLQEFSQICTIIICETHFFTSFNFKSFLENKQPASLFVFWVFSLLIK